MALKAIFVKGHRFALLVFRFDALQRNISAGSGWLLVKHCSPSRTSFQERRESNMIENEAMTSPVAYRHRLKKKSNGFFFLDHLGASLPHANSLT